MSKRGRRKRPGRHTVHPTDPRYNVSSYPRGEGQLATQSSGGPLIHAPIKYRCSKCGTIFDPSTIEHHQVCPNCRFKSGVPYHGESSKSQVWMDKWMREREEYIKRGKPLSKLEERIVRHKASLILGRDFGESPEDFKKRKGLTEYFNWKLDTSKPKGNPHSGGRRKKSRGLSRADKIKALMNEFGYTKKEATTFLKDMGEY